MIKIVSETSEFYSISSVPDHEETSFETSSHITYCQSVMMETFSETSELFTLFM